MTILSPMQEVLQRRPRRNRQSAAVRALVKETHLHPSQLIAPLFVIEGERVKQTISSLPDVHRLSTDLLVKEIIDLYEAGIRGIDLFCVISNDKKDPLGSEAVRENNLLQNAIRQIKQEIPEMCLMVDVALDPFTDHGHDGIVNERGEIDNDLTLPQLVQMSLLAAEAGADFIAPSDMMDGRVSAIRQTLDQNGFTQVGIMSYAAKYASAFYGPFREVLGSAPKFGDKKTYQMNPANVREALIECSLDEAEGADILMIKPALPFLDVIAKVRAHTNLPIAAYHVSGEYAMVMAAAQNGWMDADRALEECLISIKRAGADMIFTYAAKRIARQLEKNYRQ